MYQTIYDEIKGYAKDLGFDNIYIICAPHGHVMFSLQKSDDLGTNLGTGKYKDSILARIWRKVVSTGKEAIIDFEKYPPLNNKYVSFIGASIKNKKGKIVAVLAATLSISGAYENSECERGAG